MSRHSYSYNKGKFLYEEENLVVEMAQTDSVYNDTYLFCWLV